MTIDGRIALDSLEANTLELSVSMLTSGSRRVAIGIDSGAEIPVWPETLHSEVESQSTQQSLSREAYWAPGDLKEPSVKNLGVRNYSIEVDGHAFRHMPNICHIRKPLLAVSGMNDQGWDVHFMSREGAWMEHRQTSTFINLKRTGGRFELSAEVKGDSRALVFQGQAARL